MIAAWWLSLSLAPTTPATGGAAPAEVSAATPSDAAKYKSKAKPGTEEDDDAPPLTKYAIEFEIQSREKQILVDRTRAIGLLEEFITHHSDNRALPEALFRLSGLYWEDSQADFLVAMQAWSERVDTCRSDPESCPDGPPAEPQLDLRKSQTIYVRMIRDHPKFRKLDTVRYLYGFSLRDQGEPEKAQEQFQAIVRDHPHSQFVPDAWLAIGDHRFYVDGDFEQARQGYVHVLEYPDSESYPMALFKTAWCHWKLGQTQEAVLRFKEVLDQGADPTQDVEQRKRLADLREQALEYLVRVLSEDENTTPKDIHDFLASIDGEKYSRRVLVRLGEAYEAQTRYDKSVPTWRFLIGLDKVHKDSAGYQLHVAIGTRGNGDVAGTLDELDALDAGWGPRTSWGKGHVAAARRVDDEAKTLLFDMGRSVHESAQAAEADTKVPDPDRYALAVRAYEDFVVRWPSDPRAVELSYFSGDIYRIKLQRFEPAGDAYLRVGESAPVGQYHRDALLAAVVSYRTAIEAGPTVAPTPEPEATPKPEPEPTPTGEPPTPPKPDAPAVEEGAYSPIERKLMRAVDLFSKLFPDDPEAPAVLFSLGEFFDARGDHDAAVHAFGRIAVDHPDSEYAAQAGDHILESLKSAKDYDNIERWAEKLKEAPAFKAKDEQERLDRIAAESLLAQGQSLYERGYYERAAGYYLRVANEHSAHTSTPLALSNAATSLERADRARDATAVYERLIKDHPSSPEAAKANLVVAGVYENMADYEAAAKSYDALVDGHKNHPGRGKALYEAGVLYQALGRSDVAVARYRRYAKEFDGTEEAVQAELRAAELLLSRKEPKGAAAILKKAGGRTDDETTAHVQLLLGKSLRATGKVKDADKAFARAAKIGRAGQGQTRLYGAEARYQQGELVYARFTATKLDDKPSKLGASLEKKAALLGEAKEVFLDVLAFNTPEWSTGALLRIGEAYEAFAKSLRGAAVPKGLSEDEEIAYHDKLDTYALAFEEEAITAYRNGYKRALELGIYNVHTRQIRAALGRLSSEEYPPIVEAGADVQLAEGGTQPRPVRRLAR